jgi:hypothetical protein
MKLKNLLFLFLLNFHQHLFSQWDANTTTVNNPVSTVHRPFADAVMVSDGYGGAIIAWVFNQNVFVQRKTVAGMISWGDTSSAVSLFNSPAGSATAITDIAEDRHGGIYLCWVNVNTVAGISNVYLQHISATGKKQFGVNGIKVNPAGNPICTTPEICTTSNGIIVVWGTEIVSIEGPKPRSSSIWAQRYNTHGEAQWPNEIRVSKVPGLKFWPSIISNGNDGVMVAFTDSRNGELNQYGYYTNLDIYIQNISGEGIRLWDTDDIAVNTGINDQTTYTGDYAPGYYTRRKMISDGVGGGILFFNSAGLLNAQRIGSNSDLLWPVSGVLVTQDPTSKFYQQIVSDGDSGVIITWKDVGGNADVYVQRVTGPGSLPWGINGIRLNGSSADDFNMTGISVTADGHGNYVACWKEDGSYPSYNSYLKAQKFNNDGVQLWDAAGVFVCSNENLHAIEPMIVKSVDSSLIIAWTDNRGLYSALIQNNGSLKSIPAIDFINIAQGNWSDPAIWSGNVVPPPGVNVVIQQNVTLEVNIICNSITVKPPAGALLVKSGVTIDIIH